MIKHICQFIASAGLVGAVLAPVSAEAKYLSLDGHACRFTPGEGGYGSFYCPIPVGSEFNANTINAAIVDGFTYPGWVDAIACRRTYSQFTVTCGTTATGNHATASTYQRWLDVTALKGGNPWDFRWVRVAQKSYGDEGATVGGVYVGNTDP